MKLICSSSFHASQLSLLLLIPSLVVSPVAAQSPLPANAPGPNVAGSSVPGSSDVAAPGALANTPANTDLQLRVVESAGPEVKVNSTPAQGFTVAVTNAAGASVSDAAVAIRLPDSGPSGTFSDGSHAAVAYTDAQGLAHFTGVHWNQTPGSLAMRISANKGDSHAALVLNRTLTSDTATVVQVPPAPAISAAATAPAATTTAAPQLPQPGQTANSQAPAKGGANPVGVTPAPPVTTASTNAAKVEPAVSVTGASQAAHNSNKKKWVILAAVVAAAGVGAVAASSGGKSSTPAPTVAALSIGTPSISVGHP